MARRWARRILTAWTLLAFAGAVSDAAAQDTPLDNVSFFVGLDGSKQPQDLGINANHGLRVSGNVGLAVSRTRRVGIQVGIGLNMSDAAVHVLDQIEGTSRRTQTFVTVGVFQSLGDRATWGLAYDALFQQYYDDMALGQVRGFAGYSATPSTEVGLWFTKSAIGADAMVASTAVRLDPISQVNGFVSRTWPTRARTTFWLGAAAGHDNVVLVFPENTRSTPVLVYGAALELPLSDRFAVSGSANFLTPTATGTVDAFLGLTFYPGKSALRPARPAFAPAQAVASNPMFAVNLRR